MEKFNFKFNNEKIIILFNYKKKDYKYFKLIYIY